jgi:quinolinate synthase
MFIYARESQSREFIIVTEAGMLHRLKKENPGKRFYLASRRLICPNMKMTTLDSVAAALEKMEHQVAVGEEIRGRAAGALERMLRVGGKE